MPWMIPAAIVGGSVIGGVLTGNATKDAAQTSADASRYAADIGNQQYEQTREDMMPWHDAGVNALAQYSGYGRSQIDPNQYIPQSNIPQYNPNFDLTNDPSYLWRQQEQERGINRNMAGMGKMMSGNRLDEIMKRSGEMASQEYAAADARNVRDYDIGRANEATQYARGIDQYGRAYGEEGDYLNRLAAISNLGNASTTNMGSFGATNAANAANAAQAAGNAQAAGQIGSANAYANTISDLSYLGGQYLQANQTPYADPWVSNDPSVWGT